MVRSDDIIARKCAQLVCEAIGEPDVTPKTLFNGKTQIPVARAAARHFFYCVMHDIYGYSYTQLSKLTGKNSRGIIRAVHKVREYAVTDKLYSVLSDKINNLLNASYNE
jgi:hypothetical protein